MQSSHRIATMMAATLCVGIGGPAFAGPVTFRTVALSGDPAPGASAGATFFVFKSSPTINSAGQTAFKAVPTVDFVDGIWSEGTGTLSLVASWGDPAPGTPAGVTFTQVLPNTIVYPLPHLNDAGQTAFVSSLTGPGVNGSNDLGIWTEGSGTLALVARGGDQAPGTAVGVVYSDQFFSSRLSKFNNAGQSAFHTRLTGPGVDFSNDQGIWTGAPGSVTLLARKGDPAPGTPVGVTFDSLIGGNIYFNNAGETAFHSSFAGAEIGDGIWSGGPGTLFLVARSGDQAPGLPAGVSFGGFLDPRINDAGQTVFRSSVTGPGVNTSNDGGIWSEGPGTLSLVAREGDQAAGMAAGVSYLVLTTSYVLNGAGQTVFQGLVTGPGINTSNDNAIWSKGLGAATLVARDGDPAPGTPAGVVFSLLSTHMINGAGQIALTATLTGPGVGGANNVGLWVRSPAGVWTLIIRAGDLFEVAPGDFRTVGVNGLTFAGVSGGEDGRPTGFNDAGQLAFRATFTDGSSGLFVANASPVLPEDTNGDGAVDVLDLIELLLCFGAPAVPGCEDEDINGDGTVDVLDLIDLLLAFGTTSP